MTFLELVVRLHAEAGVAGTAPATVVGQTGILLKLVNWIVAANDDIQNLHPAGWKFLQTAFSFVTVADQRNYTEAEAGITVGVSEWKTDAGSTRLYLLAADESYLVYYDWDLFRLTYKTGSARTVTGRPIVYTIKPDNTMELGAIPDAVYTVNGEYFKQAQTLDVTVDTNLSLIPSQYHMAIVYRALMFYGADKGAPDIYSHGNNEYKYLLGKLEKNQLPRIRYGAPLA
jgi:hypothetical protein